MKAGSSSSGSRPKSNTQRYCRQALNSMVNGPFGNPKPSKNEEQSTSKAKDQTQKSQPAERIQVISKDLIRSIKIPCEDPSGRSHVFSSAEMERIISASRYVRKEKEAMKEAFQRMKEEEKISLAEEWKRQIHEADLSRKEHEALSELEVEAREKEELLLEQANTMMMERDVEIKKLNKLILGAQCQAVRDAQIVEKKQVQEEWAEEEKRLDAVMEVNRRKGLETMEQNEELRKQQRISGMQQILQQIQQRLEERNQQKDRKEVEKLQIREKLQTMKLEELAELEKKRMEQQRLQQEIMHINAESIQLKELRKEEERLADVRNMEYILRKQEQEKEYETQQKQLRKEKELEIARLRARQEKAKDYQAEQDELRARRDRDIKEREWRNKTREEAERKAQEEAILKIVRLEQVKQKEHFLSLEAGREKAEFERVLKAQQEAIRKEKEEEERRHQKARSHAEEVLQQLKEQQLSSVEKERELRKERERLMEEGRQRCKHLEEMKAKKLKELKNMGLPEKYCSELEKKVHGCKP